MNYIELIIFLSFALRIYTINYALRDNTLEIFELSLADQMDPCTKSEFFLLSKIYSINLFFKILPSLNF